MRKNFVAIPERDLFKHNVFVCLGYTMTEEAESLQPDNR